jgi:hypothetical protein
MTGSTALPGRIGRSDRIVTILRVMHDRLGCLHRSCHFCRNFKQSNGTDMSSLHQPRRADHAISMLELGDLVYFIELHGSRRSGAGSGLF